jgi:hypothetical protein
MNPTQYESDERVNADFEKEFAKKTYDSYQGWTFDDIEEVKSFIKTQRKKDREAIVEMMEGMKGLSENPDFFIRIQDKLSHNAALVCVSREAITQAVWEAKDTTLDDLADKLKSL